MRVRDADRLVDLIPRIHEAAIEPDRWEAVIGGMEYLIRTPMGTVVFEDRVSPEASFVKGIRFDAAYNAEFLRRRDAEDYWLHGVRTARTGRIVVGSDLIDPREMRKTAFYNDLGRPLNVDHMLLAVLASDTSQHACVSFLRGREAGDFGGAEASVLRALLPHFQAAYALHRHLGTRAAPNGCRPIVSALLDRCDDGMVLIDHGGRIVMMNSVAEEILRDRDGLGSVQRRLVAADHDADRALTRLILQTASTDEPCAGGYVRVDRPSGSLPYLLSVRPLPDESDEFGLPAEVGCLVTIEDPARTPDRDTAAWRELYGLTKSEARLCELLFDGQPLKRAAGNLFISENTARSHLKHIFDKCRVNSQSMLVQRLMKGRRLSEPLNG